MSKASSPNQLSKVGLWSFLLLMVAVIAVMIKLSLWQWDRGAQKQQLLNDFGQRSQQVQAFNSLDLAEVQQYQRVRVDSASWLKQQVWLDNQLQQGRAGYQVYRLAETNQGKVLVRLGWLASESRDYLPNFSAVNAPEGEYLLRYPSQAPLLNEQYWAEQFAEGLRVQSIDIAKLEQRWQLQLLPFVLDPQLQPNAEQLVAMPPAKHQGYALQWALMALVASLLTGWTIWKWSKK